MEIIIALVVLLIVYGIFVSTFSSKATKLLRRVWSAERTGQHEAKSKAIDELLVMCSVIIPKTKDDADIDKLGAGIVKLMGMASEFDKKNPNNFGVTVNKIIDDDLEIKLRAADLSDLVLQMMESQSIVVGSMQETAESIGNRISKIKWTIEMFNDHFIRGKWGRDSKNSIYFIGFCYGFVTELCQFDEVDCGELELLPIAQEMERLFGAGINAAGTSYGIKMMIRDGYGAEGFADGKIDGHYACDPKNSPPYWSKLDIFFNG